MTQPTYLVKSSSFKVFRKFFTREEVDEIFDFFDKSAEGWSSAGAVNSGDIEVSYNSSRKSLYKGIDPSSIPVDWKNRVELAARKVIPGTYDFSESWAVQRYKHQDRGHFYWHHDVLDHFLFHTTDVGKTPEEIYIKNTRPRRKISISVALNDRSDYNGGQFIIDVGDGEQTPLDLNKGDMVAFDSYTHHGVEDVTEGERRALIIWLIDYEENKEWEQMKQELSEDSTGT